VFFYLGDRQMNRWTGPLHGAALAVASGGLINKNTLFFHRGEISERSQES